MVLRGVGVGRISFEDVEDGAVGAVVASVGATAVRALAHGVIEDSGEVLVGDALVGELTDAHAAKDRLLEIHRYGLRRREWCCGSEWGEGEAAK